MKSLVIKNSWFLESDIRLDASYHLSGGPLAKLKISRSPHQLTKLSSECLKIFSGNIFKRAYVNGPMYGWPYLTGSDMVKADIESGKFLSKKHTTQADNLMIYKNWILISCSGTLGNCVFTNENFEGKIGTHDLIRVIPNERNLLKGCLFAFLSSKFGYSLLTQSSYGGVIKHIEPHHIEDINIPVFPSDFQVKINDLINSSAELRVKATKLKKEAHQIFEKHITLQSRSKNAGVLSSKKIANNYHIRFDSSHYLNIEEPENELSKSVNNSVRLGEIVERKMFTAQRGKRNYIGPNGIRFLSTTDISEANPLLVDKYLSWKTIGLETLIVKKNWILISSSGQDILGSAYMVDNTYANCAVNQHSIRVIVDERKISSYYVFGFLSLPNVKEYIRSGIYGSAVLTIDENFLKNLLLPMLDNIKMENIIQLMKLSTESFEQACFLEKEAIELVEKEIQSWEK
jgi:restriction endonuclease S subunit